MSRFLTVGVKVFGLLLLAGFLVLETPNQASATVRNQLLVENSTSEGVNFFINGKLYITNISPGPAGARDCYPSRFGDTGDLHFQAVGVNSGTVYLDTIQRGSVLNLKVVVR